MRNCVSANGDRTALVDAQVSQLIQQRAVQPPKLNGLVRERPAGHLAPWLQQVEASASRELRSFVEGIRKDYAAVEAGLTLSWSNGQTESQVGRLKLLKRAMYGRAGFELLRRRVVYRVPDEDQRAPAAQRVVQRLQAA